MLLSPKNTQYCVNPPPVLYVLRARNFDRPLDLHFLSGDSPCAQKGLLTQHHYHCLQVFPQLHEEITTAQVITYPSGQSYSYIGARCSVMPGNVLVPLVASSFEGFHPVRCVRVQGSLSVCLARQRLHRRTCIDLQEQKTTTD